MITIVSSGRSCKWQLTVANKNYSVICKKMFKIIYRLCLAKTSNNKDGNVYTVTTTAVSFLGQVKIRLSFMWKSVVCFYLHERAQTLNTQDIHISSLNTIDTYILGHVFTVKIINLIYSSRIYKIIFDQNNKQQRYQYF